MLDPCRRYGAGFSRLSPRTDGLHLMQAESVNQRLDSGEVVKGEDVDSMELCCHAEVLGRTPREVAPVLGMEANAVPVLLIRARAPSQGRDRR